MRSVSTFGNAIEAARRAAPTRAHPPETSSLDDGAEVQLSIRLPEGLRSAVAATAAAQNTTVTAFVHRTLRRAVTEESDSFAGLAAELADSIRAEIRSALTDGTYREASAEVEREEAWS